MATRRVRPWLVLFLALTCGAAAATLALRYIRARSTPMMAVEVRKAHVVIASRDIPVGTVIREGDVEVLDWPGTSAPAGYLPALEDAIGRGLITSVHQNEPILEAKLAPTGMGGGLTTMISAGMRAVSVKVDEVIGVAGFVLPDTRVDVLLTLDKGGATREPATEVLMQNVRTLAAGQEIQRNEEGKPRSVPVVTLLVSPQQAETLALAANQGRIQLALRNGLDTSRVLTSGARLGGLFSSSASSPTLPRAAPSGRIPIARLLLPARDSTVVEVYKGGARTLLRF
jgi:pilus assembly protein CpaB